MSKRYTTCKDLDAHGLDWLRFIAEQQMCTCRYALAGKGRGTDLDGVEAPGWKPEKKDEGRLS